MMWQNVIETRNSWHIGNSQVLAYFLPYKIQKKYCTMKKIEIKDIFLSTSADGESEFFPLLSDEDEQKIDKEKNPDTLPCLLYTSPSPRDP